MVEANKAYSRIVLGLVTLAGVSVILYSRVTDDAARTPAPTDAVTRSYPQAGPMREFSATWLGASPSGSRMIGLAGASAYPTADPATAPLAVSAWPQAEAEHELGYTPRAAFGLADTSQAIVPEGAAPVAANSSDPAGAVAAPSPISDAAAATPSAPPLTTGSSQAARHPPLGDYQLVGAPSISVATIEAVLRQFNSPAVGNGQAFYDLGVKYGVDPAFMLAFYVHESAAGTAGAAVATRSVGNIICVGWAGRCIGRFRAYDSYAEAAEDWYQLITGPLYIGAGLDTPEQITPRYAPDSDNNDSTGYAKTVERLVDQWRAQQQ